MSEVLPDAQLGERALEMARVLARGATRSLGRTKSLVDGARARTLEQQLELEHRSMVACGADVESAEGVSAFLAKRAPRFS